MWGRNKAWAPCLDEWNEPEKEKSRVKTTLYTMAGHSVFNSGFTILTFDEIISLLMWQHFRLWFHGYSPGFAQWHGLWRSCRSSMGRRTLPHSKTLHILQEQWSSPGSKAEVSIFLFFVFPAEWSSIFPHISSYVTREALKPFLAWNFQQKLSQKNCISSLFCGKQELIFFKPRCDIAPWTKAVATHSLKGSLADLDQLDGECKKL